MIKQALLATAFAVGLTSFAAAQAAPSPAAPPAPIDAAAPPPPAGDMPPAPGNMPPPPPRKGPHPGDHRGPPPPPPLSKGVEIRMGRDTGIRIECGDEPMAACLAAAKPLTDKIPNLTMPPAPTALPTAAPMPDDMPAPAAN